MRKFLNIASALSDSSRLRLLLSLSENELCVCSLVDLVGLADSTVSKHMSILREAGLVESRKCGRWVYYRLSENNESPMVRDAIEFARHHLSTDPVIVADATRVTVLHCSNSVSVCQVEPVSHEIEKTDTQLATA